jgi:hypothetical protein
LGRDEGFPGSCRTAQFGLEKGEGGCREDEINPDSACGCQSSGYTKGFFCKTAFSPRTGLAKNGDSFHEGL